MHDPEAGALVVIGGEGESCGGREILPTSDEWFWMNAGADGGAEGIDGGRSAVNDVGPKTEDEIPGDGVGDRVRHGEISKVWGGG